MITQRRRLLVVILLAFVAVMAFLSQSLVILTINRPSGSDSKPLSLTYLNKNGGRGNVFNIGPLALVPRDTERIEAKITNWRTTADVTPLPIVGWKNITITVERDKNVDKVTGDGLGCVAYDATSNTVASYACNNPNGLYVYKTSKTDNVPWKNEAFLTFPQAFSVAHYKNGLLGISNSASPELFYADMQSKSVSLPLLPPGVNQKDLGNMSIMTDAVTDSDHFLLVNSANGAVYFATQQGDSTTYRRYSPDKSWLTVGSIVQCVLRQTIASCYIGGASSSPDSEHETKASEERSDGRIVTVDFKSDKLDYSISTVPKSEPADNLYVDGSGQLYTVTNGILYSLNISTAASTRTIVAPNIAGVASGKTLQYITDNKLYEFDNKSKQTFLRFYSKNLRLSTVNQIGPRVFINGYVQSAPNNTVHTFQLLSEPNTTPGERLVDKLPIYSTKTPTSIIAMDYTKDTIHVVLPRYVSYNASGKIVPNEQRYNEEKVEALNYLSIEFPPINNYTVTFSQASDS